MPSGSISTSTRSPGGRMLERRAQRFEPTPVVEPDDEADDGPGPHGALHLVRLPAPEAGRTDTASAARPWHRRRFRARGSGRRRRRRGCAQSSSGVAVCTTRPFTHHGDAIAERERLRPVVGDVDRRHGELVEESFADPRAGGRGARGRASREARREGGREARARGPARGRRAGAHRRTAFRRSGARSPSSPTSSSRSADPRCDLARAGLRACGARKRRSRGRRGAERARDPGRRGRSHVGVAARRRGRRRRAGSGRRPARCRPAITRSSVVFPDPLGPRIVTTSPAPTLELRAVEGERLLEPNADVLHPEHR